ncbi:MAG: LUD domain-containing protein [Saccharothrix sp.]|nr:LUD domain-containing protein [Saccharothrix sp.]
MNPRTEVLSRIRAANQAARAMPPPIPRNHRRTGTHPAGAPPLLDMLRDRLTDYRATVIDTDDNNIPAAIAEALHTVDRPVVIPPGLPPTWCPTGIRDTDDLPPAALDHYAAVITACAAACAETGTIVLNAAHDQGRRALTLVPDTHICVVHANQVVQTVPELLAQVDPLRPLTFISGPSATSDIELERVEGVHGPRTLVVLLVAQASSESSD